MRFIKYMVMTIMVMMIIGAMAGCSKPEQKPAEEKLMVGVSLPDVKSARGKAIKKALEENKGEKVKFLIEDAKNDAAQQEMQVQKLLDKKIKVLVIEFIDPQQAMRLAEQVKSKGIKLLALNTLPSNVPLEGFIGPDYQRVGQLQGQYILNQQQQLTKDAVLALVEKDHPNSQLMLSGLKSTLAGNISLEVREINVNNPTVAQEDMKKAATGLDAGGVSLSSAELTKMLLSNAVDPAMITVGAGINKESAQAILTGVHDADVDLMPDLVGTYAAKAAENLASEGFWQSDTVLNNGNYDIPATLVPVRLITKENLFLVRERLGKLEAKSAEQGQSQNSGGGQSQGQSQGGQSQNSQAGGGGQQGTKLIIETADGKKMELQINGEIKSVQMQKGGKQKQQQQQQQQQGGGGGQQQSGGS